MYKRFRCKIPMNLQVFAEPGGAGGGNEPGQTQNNQNTNNQQAAEPPSFDYEKLANLIAGKQSVTEESVLKGYFKQQGLSKEQMDQAITAFKQQQAANTPDVNAMQTQLSQTQSALKQEQMKSAATMAAVSIGIDAKTIPYVLKMADLSKVMDQEGKINEEEVKNAINKVLEDVPALKPQVQQASGFKFGASGQNQQTTANEDALKKAFGL